MTLGSSRTGDDNVTSGVRVFIKYSRGTRQKLLRGGMGKKVWGHYNPTRVYELVWCEKVKSQKHLQERTKECRVNKGREVNG